LPNILEALWDAIGADDIGFQCGDCVRRQCKSLSSHISLSRIIGEGAKVLSKVEITSNWKALTSQKEYTAKPSRYLIIGPEHLHSELVVDASVRTFMDNGLAVACPFISLGADTGESKCKAPISVTSLFSQITINTDMKSVLRFSQSGRYRSVKGAIDLNIADNERHVLACIA
jgi:hypothetical protein